MGAVLSCFKPAKRPAAPETVAYENPVSERTTAVIEYVLVNEKAHAPYIASENAAGMDLCAAEETIIPSMDGRLVDTGLKLALPEGYYGRIAPRSGLAIKHLIDCGAGVIDPDYRGQIKVLLFNLGRTDFEVHVGDRIAQLICEKIAHPVPKMVKQLSDTKRGSAGFGSTGIKIAMCGKCVESMCA